MKKLVSQLLVTVLAIVAVFSLCKTPVYAEQITAKQSFVDVPEIEIGKRYTAAQKSDTSIYLPNDGSLTSSYLKLVIPNDTELKLSLKELVGGRFDVYFSILDSEYNKVKGYSVNKSSITDKFTLSKGTYYIKFTYYMKSYYAFKFSIPEKAVALNRNKANISVGDTTTLKLKNATDVTWVSGKCEVATVSSDGKVTGQNKGTAVIFAIYDNKVYQCTVKVTD